MCVRAGCLQPWQCKVHLPVQSAGAWHPHKKHMMSTHAAASELGTYMSVCCACKWFLLFQGNYMHQCCAACSCLPMAMPCRMLRVSCLLKQNYSVGPENTAGSWVICYPDAHFIHQPEQVAEPLHKINAGFPPKSRHSRLTSGSCTGIVRQLIPR